MRSMSAWWQILTHAAQYNSCRSRRDLSASVLAGVRTVDRRNAGATARTKNCDLNILAQLDLPLAGTRLHLWNTDVTRALH